MADEHPAKGVVTCDFCGKRSTEVRKVIVGRREGGQEPAICNECLLICVGIMIEYPNDREWFERGVEEMKARLG